VPEGVVNAGDEWFYEEYVRNAGVTHLGLEGDTPDRPQVAPMPMADEKKKILELFKN